MPSVHWRNWLRPLGTMRGTELPRSKGRRKRPAALELEFLETRLTPAAPTVLSINRTSPTGQFTNATSVTYTVTFDQPVTGVDAADFKIVADGALTFNAAIAVSGNNASYSVAINDLRGAGSLRLDLIDDDLILGSGLPLGGAGANNGSFQGQPYSLSTNAVSIAPFVQSVNRTAPFVSTTATFTAAFSEPVTGVDASDFQIAATGSANGVISSVSAIDGSYNVAVTNIVGLGEIGVKLVDNGTIRDADGNPLVDRAAPFSAQTTWAAGPNPTATAAVDINGDGRIDLVASNAGSHTVNVLLGNGNGTFKPPIASPLVQKGENMTVADVNGDGKLDVLSDDTYGRHVAVLLGNGDGTFRPATTTAALSTETVVAADVNGDGKADLIIPGKNANRVGVKLGTGDGAFAPQTTYTVASAAYVAVADFNADAKPDIAVASQNSTASILLGNGNGAFQAPITFATGSGGSFDMLLAVADLDGNGTPDIVIPNSGGSTASIHLGNGNGTFKPFTTVPVGERPTQVAIDDFNRDGAMDLVVSVDGVNNASVLLGNGDGTFRPKTDYPMDSRPRTVVVADLNGDGRPDFATGNAYTPNVGVRLAAPVVFTGQTATIDKAAPIATITSQPPANSLKQTATFAFSATDPTVGGVTSGVSRFEYQLDGGTFSTATSPTTLTGLAGGSHTFAVRAVDNAGNIGAAASYTWNVDVISAPSAESIVRATPAGTLANGTSVSYSVTFNALVSGVDPADFSAVTTGTVTTGAITVSGSGDAYAVTINGIAGDGTLLLRLNDNDSILSTINSLPIGGPGDNGGLTGPAYTIDRTAPTAAITAQPPLETLATSATFSFTGADPTAGGVSSGVHHLEYSLDGGAFITATSPLTLNSLSLANHTFQVRAVDNAGNVGTSASYSWTVSLPPFVQSITRTTPSGQFTNASSVVYTVTFSRPVTGVDAADFKVVVDATLRTGSLVIAGSGASYTATISGIVGTGALRLDLIDNDSIASIPASIPLGGTGNLNGSFAGASYIVSLGPTTVAPYLASIARLDAATQTASPVTLSFAVNFSKPVTGVDVSDFQVQASGGAQASISQVASTNGMTYTVSLLATGSGPGSVGLSFVNNGSIRDADNNPLVNHNIDFTGPTTYPLVFSDSFLSVADLNGDGFTDAILPIQNETRTAILLGNGDGTFRPVNFVSTPQRVYKEVLADVNGDGKPDLVSPNMYDSYVMVLLGNGNGTFQGALTSAANRAFCIVTGDLNGDGKIDVVVTGGGLSGFVGVSLGNGDGRFRPQTTFATPANPHVPILADLNNDGMLDVAVPNRSGHNVAVLLGNGDGTMRPATAFATSISPQAVVAGDVSGDGIPDLITVGFSSQASVLLGNGNGTFKPAVMYPTGANAVTAVLADFNADGALDLATGNNQSDDATVLLGNGDGTFQPFTAYPMGSRSRSIAAADFNGDGRPDFATGNHYGASFSVRLNREGPSGINAPSYFLNIPLATAAPYVASIVATAGSPSNASSVAFTVTFSKPVVGVNAADFQVTGVAASIETVVAIDGKTYTVTVAGIVGSGSITLSLIDDGTIRDANDRMLVSNAPVFASQITYNVSTPPHGLAAGDINGDGFVDLATGHGNEQAIRLLLANGNGTFQSPKLLALGRKPATIAFADIDGDGKLDLVASTYLGSGISVLLGNGNGTFKPRIDTYSSSPSTFAIGDIDGDGKPDIAVVGNNSSGDIGVFLGNGNGTFKPRIGLPAASHPRWVGLADFNTDGKLDIAFGSDVAAAVGVMLGCGNGAFGPRTLFASGEETHHGAIADLNGDGKPDIVIQEYFSFQNVLLNNGDGSFKTYVPYPTGFGHFHGIEATDINGDGLNDLVGLSKYNSLVTVRLGKGDGTFGNMSTFATLQGPLRLIVADLNSDGRPDFATSNSAFSNGTLGVFLQKNGSFTGPSIVVDQAPPTVTITASPPTATQSTTANFVFSGNDPVVNGVSSGVHHFEYQLDSGNFATAASPLTLTGLSEGTHAFRVRAVDNAGNVGTEAVATWMVDTTAPTAAFTATPPPFTFGSATIGFAGNDPISNGVASGVNRLEYKLDNGAFQTATNPLTLTNLAAGSHTVSIRAVDNAGNISTVVSTSWVVDLFPASVQSINRFTPATTSTNAASVTFQVTFNKSVTGVDAGDFAVSLIGATASPLVAVAEVSGSVYNVTVSGIAGGGTLALNLVDNGSIRDLLGFPLAPTNAPANFQPQQIYAAGPFPRAAALADLNADGKTDLIVANSSGSSVSVLLGNGNGAFQAQQTFSADVHPETIAVGDISGDGKPDLVLGSSNTSTVSVLLGNGDGSLQSPTQWDAGTGPYSVALGDVNGDGKLDLAVANKSSNFLSVLLGNGNGTLQAQLTFAAGSQPAGLALGDVSGDGKLDLVAANAGAGSIGVLLGNGNGTFQGQATFAAGAGAGAVALADLDVDGRLDIAVANSDQNSVSVLLGNGGGTFKPQRTFTSTATPVGLAVAHLNGDRKPDLAVANLNGALGVLLGNGDGTFAPQATFASGNAPAAVAAGDVTGDGRADLVGVNVFDGTASIYVNALNGSFLGQSYTVDRVGPTTSITANPPAATNGTFASFSFSATDPVVGGISTGVNHLEYQIDGGGFITATSPRNLAGLGQGSHTFQARAVDNLGNIGDAASYTWIIDLTGPTSTITAQPPAVTSSTSASFTFAATDPLAGGVSTGVQRIEYRLDGGAFTATTSPVNLTNLGAGNHTFAVRAIDNVGNIGATATYAWTVDPTAAPTATTLAANPNATTGGTLVTFTATIAPSPGNLGTVAFKDNGVTLSGAGNVPVVSGVATFTTSALIAGVHPITADYSGALGFASSSSNVIDFTVTSAATTTTVTAATPNPALPTQPIAITVTVAGGAPTAGDAVTLVDATSGNAPVAASGGILANGTATLTIAPGTLAAGTHNLVARYAGNSFNAPSQSAPVPLLVAAAPQVVSITPNGNLLSFAGPQRSRVVSALVVFDRAVQLDAGALALAVHTKNVTFGGVPQPAGVGAVPTTLQFATTDNIAWTITFAGNTDDGADGLNSLRDGVYDVVVDAAKVHLLGVPGISMAANLTATFHRLFGDTTAPTTPAGGTPGLDFEAVVNTGDNLTFRGAFNNPVNYKPYLDFNGDGLINSGDNLQFRNRFNKALSWRL